MYRGRMIAHRVTRGIGRLLPIVVVAVALAAASSAEARPRPSRHQSNFEANKTFGVGLILGQPTGVSGKYFLGRDTALDFAVGFLPRVRDRNGLQVHVDYLWHPVSLVSAEPFELPLYFGVGGHFFDFGVDNVPGDNHGTGLGVRVPGGIAFDFNNIPLDIFVELAFVFDIVVDYGDSYWTDLNGAAGVRYYFN